ncbi:hypothetical protein PpBr36_01475 [Pyricularia pennisetigena]|uniref:hypothetical protein n=1 Tax=Pyricularia pennisetigena TaxID=1578925 RepID=UPI001154D16C|nr:hypothetical protein PpBr36_01475 [Pyricularia pennisetigena]TLS29266.1 hypothetical protein PpBr36_01475 [Pyricularia pennisetigena]
MSTLLRLLTFLVAALAVSPFVGAQDVPLLLIGAFEGATANDDSFNTGGFVDVLGQSVTVPQNLQVAFPATFVPWKDFVGSASKFLGYEISVVGNYVNGVPIAGQISINQFSLGAGVGYIEKINADGTLGMKNGIDIRINDPTGMFGVVYDADPFFTADPENPSITSFSGFPMCVPRNASDPLCPDSQRPVLSGGTKQGTFLAVDPLVMAPLVPGDWIEYSGFKRGNTYYAYEIVATNVQITTDPSRGDPTYIRVEDALIGVFNDGADVESAETKMIGYTSAQAASVTMSAVDIDVCTGKTTLREIGAAATRAGQVRNKFEFRAKSTAPTKYTQQYLFMSDNGVKTTKNGIKAGQYMTPVTEWIQPELTTPGLPPPQHYFQDMDYATNGLGFDGTNIWGPLTPFPQSGVAVFNTSSCPPPSTDPSPEPTATTATATPSPTSTVVADTVTFQSLTWTNSQGGTLAASCRSVAGSNGQVASSMVLQYSNRDGAFSQTMTSAGNGDFTFSARSTKQPSGNVKCLSNLGGSAVSVAP